jgi:DNA-binding response OmpR family regulator
MQRILVIDDMLPVAQGLRHDFAAAGYTVDVAGSGDVGLAAVRLHPPDLVVLDRARADMEGVQRLQRLHATAEQAPVLLVVPDPTPVDQMRWLDSGADDCVALTQPFEVVLARTRALLRRQSPPPQRLAYTDLVIDAAGHTVCRGQRQIVLTSLEFRLLYEFMLHMDRP